MSRTSWRYAKCVGPDGESIGAYDVLKDYLNYDPDTGIFTWTASTSKRIRVGDIAGTKTVDGYVCIQFQSLLYRAHRLAWFFGTGVDPAGLSIDHINRIRDDNRLENLRLATHAQNCQNKSCKGWFFDKQSQKYKARIQANGKVYHLGFFPTPELAGQAYRDASKRLHGEFGSIA